MIKQFRWFIALLLFSATAINYLDRLSLPASTHAIRQDIPMSDQEYGRLGSIFLAAYALMYVVGGRFIDWAGTRAGFAVMLVWWSLASMATGLATTLAGLALCRFLLGVGEGGGFPGAGKAVAEWFPPRERSFAFGIFNTGSALGSVLAVPLAAVIIHYSDWRFVFFITGALGLLCVGAWLALYRRPEESPFVSPEELREIQGSSASQSAAAHAAPTFSWSQLLAHRQTWALVVAKFLTDAAFYFYSFWIPKYLNEERGLDLMSLAYYGWIPYLFMAGGSFFGGWLGYHLIRRGMALDRSRKLTLTIAACLMPTSLLISSAPLITAIVFLGISLFGHQFWSSNVQTLAADIYPSSTVGSIEGLIGAAGAAGGMLFQLVFAWIVETHGYAPVFAVAGLMYPAALAIIVVVIRKVEPVHSERTGA